MSPELKAALGFAWAIALGFTALVVWLFLSSDMPVWAAAAVELSGQTGLWGMYSLIRWVDSRG